jgi:hypothetical protein
MFNLALNKEVLISVGEFVNTVGRFSYLSKDGKLYSNMRALMLVADYEDIPYNKPEDLKEFFSFKCKLPMFVWAHLVRHTQLSVLTRTGRTKEKLDYWEPDGINEKIEKYPESLDVLRDDFWSAAEDMTEEGLFENIIEVQESIFRFFKSLKFKAEIYQRIPYYCQYKTFHFAGWYNDPLRWIHLFVERNCTDNANPKNWTQRETKIAVNAIKALVMESRGGRLS